MHYLYCYISLLTIFLDLPLSNLVPQKFQFNFTSDDPIYKIIGGKKVTRLEDWSFMVALMLSDGQSRNFCTGTLIRKNWVLTAAHCVPRGLREVTGTVGRLDLKEFSGETIKGNTVIVHSDYRYGIMLHDIALIKLKKPVDGQLAKLSNDSMEDIEDLSCKTSGWGLSSRRSTKINLHELQQPLIDLQDCRDIIDEPPIYVSNLCTLLNENVPHSCVGDSGAPLMCNNHQYGILSWGYDCTDPTLPIIWTRIEHYLEWIYKTFSEFPDDEEEAHEKKKSFRKAESHGTQLKRESVLDETRYRRMSSVAERLNVFTLKVLMMAVLFKCFFMIINIKINL